MKGWIEVTELEYGKGLVSLEIVRAIRFQAIVIVDDGKLENIAVLETYEELKQKIKEAE